MVYCLINAGEFMSVSLSCFEQPNLFIAGEEFFKQLGIQVNSDATFSLELKNILKEKYKDRAPFNRVSETYFLGLVDESLFGDTLFSSSDDKISYSQAIAKVNDKYDGLMIFAVKFNEYYPKRAEIAEIIRELNRASNNMPVVLLAVYSFEGTEYLSFASIERARYIQTWREGEKTGKVSLLKDIKISKPHSGHERILRKLKIETDGKNAVASFSQLYKYWQSIFNVQALNEEFYKELTDWFYFALGKIKLPIKPDYIKTEQENVQGFLIRLISRLLFSWFLKEKEELIPEELLELENYDGVKYNIVSDINDKDFLHSNSYYRGVLQNIFYRALNQKDKKAKKDFLCTKYLPKDFNFELFTRIPYLNGGIFDCLEEDNAKETIEDKAIQIPNFLFYGLKSRQKITTGKKAGTFETVEHKGINQILRSYKFTVEENTPLEEDVALDPELLGLVFENLLAELDPQIEESVRTSIRKQNGAYYTPRKVIQEMVNESLFLYLFNYFKNNNIKIEDCRKNLHELVYFDNLSEGKKLFSDSIVEALDKLKVLDPACGSGAFPMGMLQRVVQLLKIVDPDNSRWLSLKLQKVDSFYRDKFKEQLVRHMDDYSRKLGIIKDSIYGIDMMPLAVQISKLRFFITLLIEQKINKKEINYGISPMPNIETKIVCANSLRNVQVDLFSGDIIANLKVAREKYYRPDIDHVEKEEIAKEIVKYLDTAFPTFSEEVLGKKVKGQNKVILKHWFTHSTVTAPFFNLEFFYPELAETGGFDIVIGNPPYGGTKLTDEIRDALDLESKDPYGAFIARFLGNGTNVTPLKNHGVLALIVSDTFMTIKSHRPLRAQMLNNYLHKMIRVHPDTFKATVNTVIIICERNIYQQNNRVEDKTIPNEHVCQMLDMSNISIHDEYNIFVDVLYKTEGYNEKDNYFNKDYANYTYSQNIIKLHPHMPFFISSPDLYLKLNKIKNRLFNYVEEICGGIKSYDDKAYIRNKYGNMGYETIEDSEIIKRKLTADEKVNGILKNMKEQYYIKYDKGGDTINDSGLLNMYYKEIEFYFRWDKNSVKELKSCNGLRNQHRYFSSAIGVSTVGVYAPIFRLSEYDVFFNNYNMIFVKEQYDKLTLLGVLASKVFRYILTHYENHTVAKNQIDLLGVYIPDTLLEDVNIKKMVNKIISNLKNNPNYYYLPDQKIIDAYVYKGYGLNESDVNEIETWYERRYPKLARAHKERLKINEKVAD